MADGSHFTDGDTTRGQGCQPAPDEVWVTVREAYLAGMSAPECCRRHGVGLTALRVRAAREGWRRADQPWTPRNQMDPWDEGVELEASLDGDLDRVEMRDLSWVAHRRMMRAVLRGDAVDALRWRRVREAMDAEEAEMERLTEQEEAIRRMQGGADDPHDPHDPHGVFSPPGEQAIGAA